MYTACADRALFTRCVVAFGDRPPRGRKDVYTSHTQPARRRAHIAIGRSAINGLNGKATLRGRGKVHTRRVVIEPVLTIGPYTAVTRAAA